MKSKTYFIQTIYEVEKNCISLEGDGLSDESNAAFCLGY